VNKAEAGMTLIELVIVVAVAALLMVAVTAYSVPWLQKEAMRSATFDVQTHMQLARIEAVSRNRPCRFVVDTGQAKMEVYDGNGTPLTTVDDILLHDADLPSNVTFTDPLSGSAVTLESLGSGVYQTVFASDGVVTSGSGAVKLHGGESYSQVSVFAAGGVQVAKWSGSAWYAGS